MEKILILFCITLATSYAAHLGGVCSLNSDCNYIINAECKDSVCQCISSMIQHENTCVQPVVPATSCISYTDCQIGTTDYNRICSNGQCVCKPYFNWNGSCRKNRGLYEDCLKDDDCYWGEDMVGLMTCTNLQCSCKSGMVPRGKRCVVIGA
ncbi:uncharacterized protein [Onthophagus taurus]|uniref:uncharacterized protein n=1 Tax=Onthophagus taurus TaxID=166361 RepID=UPI0039BDB193